MTANIKNIFHVYAMPQVGADALVTLCQRMAKDLQDDYELIGKRDEGRSPAHISIRCSDSFAMAIKVHENLGTVYRVQASVPPTLFGYR